MSSWIAPYRPSGPTRRSAGASTTSHSFSSEKNKVSKQVPHFSNVKKAFSPFFCWRLLGLIPGGTPFSQLNKDVRDVMSATTTGDVKHQVCAKTCKRPQVPTSSKHRKEGRVSKGAKKRAPVKSKGKHLCQSGKMQPRKRALVKPEGSTCAGARSARERQERTKV